MPFDTRVNSIKDTIAVQTAHLDQLQTKLDTNRHRLSEADVWWIQAEIDTHRFGIELDRLQLNVITDRLK